MEFYNKVNEDGKKFLIVFVSADRSQQLYTDYYNEMPWLALPFGSDNQVGLAAAFSESFTELHSRAARKR